MTDRQTIDAYQAAIRAHEASDRRLSELLIARYGLKRAGTMRYKAPETREIAEAMHAKLTASEVQLAAWLATMEPREPKSR